MTRRIDTPGARFARFHATIIGHAIHARHFTELDYFIGFYIIERHVYYFHAMLPRKFTANAHSIGHAPPHFASPAP